MTTTTTSSATATTTTTTSYATATTTSTTSTTAQSNILLNNLPHLDNSQADYHPPPQVCPLHPRPTHPHLPDFHVILGPLNTTASRVISKFVLIELQREGRTVLTGLIKDNPPLKAPTYQSL